MAKQIEGVYERVLQCAKDEFLEKGFKEASLRIIAQNAQTSTSSIYTRFGDKHGLFEALVGEVRDNLMKWFLEVQENFNQMPKKDKASKSFDMNNDHMVDFIHYIYDHYDVFRLLLTCADGTDYGSFIHDFAEIESAYTLKFIEDLNLDVLETERLSPELMHMLSSAFFQGVFETVIHGMDRETAVIYIKQMQRFYQAGWMDILQIDQVKKDDDKA